MNNFKKNIRFLLKINGIKIGEFEREHGVTVGLLSRKSKLSLDLAYNMAKSLGQSIEGLMERDYEKEMEIYDIEYEINCLQERLEELKEGYEQ